MNFNFDQAGSPLAGQAVYLQCFEQTLENSALLKTFCFLINEPCFDQLRTIEQLGYVVTSSAFYLNGVQGFSLAVQTAQELDCANQRIEIFFYSIRICTIQEKQSHLSNYSHFVIPGGNSVSAISLRLKYETLSDIL